MCFPTSQNIYYCSKLGLCVGKSIRPASGILNARMQRGQGTFEYCGRPGGKRFPLARPRPHPFSNSCLIRGQGTFEYVLLLGGVLLIVVLALVVLQGSFLQTSSGVSDVELKKCRLSAQSSVSCINSDGSFNGSKPFDLLGYQANPVLCNCSDFDPDAFTVPVGAAAIFSLDFSSATSGGYSPLYFDEPVDAPATAYAISLTLPAGKQEFFVVYPDRFIQSREPDAATPLPNGRVAYSWNSLPVGSKIKVKGSGMTDEQKTQVQTEKIQIPDAQVLEQQAGSDKVEKTVDSQSGLKLLKSKEGNLRLVYEYSSEGDYDGPLILVVPVASDSIARIFPQTASIGPDAESADSSVVSWEQVRLRGGQAFRVIIELKQSGDLQVLSDDVDSKLPSIRSKAFRKRGQSACIAKSKSCIPGGIGGSCCGDLSCDLSGLGFACQVKATPSPTPSVEASASVGPSVSPSPSPSPPAGIDACVAKNQGCALTSILPGSIDQKCCKGSTCQLEGFSSTCKPDGTATPTPLPSCESVGGVCQIPTPASCLPGQLDCPQTGTCPEAGTEVTDAGICSIPGAVCCAASKEPKENPALSDFNFVETQEWEYYEIKDEAPTPTPTPEPSPKIARELKQPLPIAAKQYEECGAGIVDGQVVACESGLECSLEDPSFANSRAICQNPKDAKVYQRPLNELSFADPTPIPSATGKASLEAREVPLDKLVTSSQGVGTAIPAKGFIRDRKGDLYLVVQKPVAPTLSSSSYTQFNLENHVLVSQDNGKTWKYLVASKSLEKGTYLETKGTVTKTTTPALTKIDYNKCVKSYEVPKTKLIPLVEGFRAFSQYTEYSRTYGGVELDSCYSNLCGFKDEECQKQYLRCYTPYFANAKPELLKKFDGMVACTTGACYCNPPTVPDGNRKDTICTEWKEVPVLVEVCTKYSEYQYEKCTQRYYGEESVLPYQTKCDPISEEDYLSDNACKNTEKSCNFVKTACEFCNKWAQKKCVESDLQPPKPTTYTLKIIEHRTRDLFSSEFQGMAPAKGDGVYIYYRFVRKKDVFDYGMLKPKYSNSSELHVLTLNAEGESSDTVLATDEGYTFPDELRFIGSSGDYQLFTRASKLFLSTDGGITLKPTGYPGRLEERTWREYTAGYCSDRSYIPAIDILHPYDVVGVLPKPFHVVAGGHVVSTGSFYPALQQDDGYFPILIRPQDKQYYSFSARINALNAGYLKHPHFNQAFYDRFEKSFKNLYAIRSAVPDSEGGLHLAFSGARQVGTIQNPALLYQYYPPSAFDLSQSKKPKRILFFDRANCAQCAQVKNWLEAANVPFQISNQLPDAVADSAPARLEKGDYPMVYVEYSDGFDTVFGNDSIRLSKALDVILDPIQIDAYFSNNLNIQIAPGGVPVIWAGSRQYTFDEGQFPVQIHVVNTGSNPQLIKGGTPSYPYIGYILPSNREIDFNDLNFGEQIKSVTQLHAFSERISDANLSAILAYQSGTSAGKLNKEIPNYKLEGIDNRYVVYSREPDGADVVEPEAGSTLNELVPFQKLRLPIPLSTASAPTLTLSSNLASIVSVKAVRSEDSANAFDAEVTLDARSYLKGGKLELPVEKVTGTISAKAGSNKAELPFSVTVKHVAPENLAYAAPSTLVFSTYQGKGVTKPVLLVNNFERPILFACGTLFSQSVAAHSVASMDVTPPKASARCTLTLDGVASRQIVYAEVIAETSETIWTQTDSLTYSARVRERPVRFKDCADGFCNCEQSQAAVDDFLRLVQSHASRIDANAPRSVIGELYSRGFAESQVLLTGTFDDLDEDRLKTCTVNFNGNEVDLKPGSAYRFTLRVPESGQWLASDRAYIESVTPIRTQWAYATQKGVQTDADTFIALVEAS